MSVQYVGRYLKVHVDTSTVSYVAYQKGRRGLDSVSAVLVRCLEKRLLGSFSLCTSLPSFM